MGVSKKVAAVSAITGTGRFIHTPSTVISGSSRVVAVRDRRIILPNKRTNIVRAAITSNVPCGKRILHRSIPTIARQSAHLTIASHISRSIRVAYGTGIDSAGKTTDLRITAHITGRIGMSNCGIIASDKTPYVSATSYICF